ncbi:hypothetical protein ACT691_08865 [Vibrio metschnikovii]
MIATTHVADVAFIALVYRLMAGGRLFSVAQRLVMLVLVKNALATPILHSLV